MDEDGKRMELEPGSALQETESQLANWYQQIDFSDVKLFIRNNIATASRSFIAIGYYLKYARDNQMYEEDGHASVWDFAMAEYGISKSTASRYMTMNVWQSGASGSCRPRAGTSPTPVFRGRSFHTGRSGGGVTE